MRPPERLDSCLGQAQMTDIAGFDELRDRADSLFDRYLRINAAEPVDVNVVRAQARQCVAEGVLDGRRASVDAEDLAAGAAEHTELDAEHELLAAAPAQSLAEQKFVLPASVVVARVEQRDPRVQRVADRRDALRLVSRTIQRRHPHAAEPERRDYGTCRTECA